MSENKVVIKINYDKDRNRKVMAEPKMVTVWHTQRILAALAILALTVIILIIGLSGDDTGETIAPQQATQVEGVTASNGDDALIKRPDVAVNTNRTPGDRESDSTKQVPAKNPQANNTGKRPAAIIFDKKVIRASLNSGAKDKELFEPVKVPIRLAENQTIDLFYFNELRNIKDKVLYHSWLKDGKAAYKKQLDIKDSRAKVLSAKTLSYKDKGEWQIQLVDRKGKVFSEVNFSVNPE